LVVFLAIMTTFTFATLCYYPWMTLLLNSLALLTLSAVLVTSYLCLTFVGATMMTESAWPKIARAMIIIINLAVVVLLLMHLVVASKDMILEYLQVAAQAVAASAKRIKKGSKTQTTGKKRQVVSTQKTHSGVTGATLDPKTREPIAAAAQGSDADSAFLTAAAAVEEASDSHVEVPAQWATVEEQEALAPNEAPTAHNTAHWGGEETAVRGNSSTGSIGSSTPGVLPTLDSL
jgi:hypothetical protein